MIALIMKMILCLIIAFILGLVLGWLLSKIAKSNRDNREINLLSSTLEDRNKHIDMLEKQFSEKETELLKSSHENRELKEMLAKKDNSLRDIESKLNDTKDTVSSNLKYKEENKKLLNEIANLKSKVESKTKELEELETVLVKAEKTIEHKDNLLSDSKKRLSMLSSDDTDGVALNSDSNSEKILKSKIEELTLANEEKDKSINLYQDTISQLESELKLYTANREEDEFIVSKDQFTHIEEQLVKYQKEIEELKEENRHLSQLRGDKSYRPEEMDDISIVKLFRETYKKITKS